MGRLDFYFTLQTSLILLILTKYPVTMKNFYQDWQKAFLSCKSSFRGISNLKMKFVRITQLFSEKRAEKSQ